MARASSQNSCGIAQAGALVTLTFGVPLSVYSAARAESGFARTAHIAFGLTGLLGAVLTLSSCARRR